MMGERAESYTKFWKYMFADIAFCVLIQRLDKQSRWLDAMSRANLYFEQRILHSMILIKPVMVTSN